MSSLVTNLETRLNQVKGLSRQIEAWKAFHAKKVILNLTPYFAAQDRPHAAGLYDALLDSSIPSREIHVRAAFYKAHSDFTVIEAGHNFLKTLLSKLVENSWQASNAYNDYDSKFRRGNLDFINITGLSIEETETSQWEAHPLLHGAKSALSPRYRKANGLLKQFREETGNTLFEMPQRVADAEEASIKAYDQYKLFDHQVLRAVCDTVEKAKHYVETAPEFIRDDLVPLFSHQDFIDQAKTYLDEESFRNVRDYFIHHEAISALLPVITTLEKILRLNVADQKLQPWEHVKRCRLNLDTITAYDDLIGILGIERNIAGTSRQDNIALGAAAVIQLQKLDKEAQDMIDLENEQLQELKKDTLLERLQAMGVGYSSGRALEVA